MCAWKYQLGDGVWRYQRERTPGAVMIPVEEITPEIEAELRRQDIQQIAADAAMAKAIRSVTADDARE
ncbi:hypothetical protein KDW07_26985 [Burkholderia dolosa]|uniref:hypothetical protein n=1 Tax=Burkholderia dolosa TaxID=152500 RepID=UPI001B93B195|nr:hypothetical protein [Burkholderia dolosa]MBR8460790.1 hypothetical protein [Burkholderia dolosa]